MPVRTRLRHHRAKIEYLASEEIIFRMLSQGFSIRLIHEELTEKGIISMAYLTLCQFLRNARKKAEPPVPEVKKRIPSGPRLVVDSDDSFPDPRNMSAKDAF